jgi:RHH-type transcriptional regulator, rel operon repressor / antitoxin RelB
MSSTTLSIRVDTSQKKRLETLAKSTGRSRSFLAADAIATYLDINEWQVAGIKSAMKSMDEKGGVPHAEVRKWVMSWKVSKPVPKPPRTRKR